MTPSLKSLFSWLHCNIQIAEVWTTVWLSVVRVNTLWCKWCAWLELHLLLAFLVSPCAGLQALPTTMPTMMSMHCTSPAVWCPIWTTRRMFRWGCFHWNVRHGILQWQVFVSVQVLVTPLAVSCCVFIETFLLFVCVSLLLCTSNSGVLYRKHPCIIEVTKFSIQ